MVLNVALSGTAKRVAGGQLFGRLGGWCLVNTVIR